MDLIVIVVSAVFCTTFWLRDYVRKIQFNAVLSILTDEEKKAYYKKLLS